MVDLVYRECSSGNGSDVFVLSLKVPAAPCHMQRLSSTYRRDVARSLEESTAKLANLSQTMDATKALLDLAFAYENTYLKQTIIDLSLLTLFFGTSRYDFWIRSADRCVYRVQACSQSSQR